MLCVDDEEGATNVLSSSLAGIVHASSVPAKRCGQVSRVITLICIALQGRRLVLCSVLATKMRQATENNVKLTKHKGIALKGCQTCVKYLQWQNLANVAKEATLGSQCLHMLSPYEDRNKLCIVLSAFEICTQCRTVLVGDILYLLSALESFTL